MPYAIFGRMVLAEGKGRNRATAPCVSIWRPRHRWPFVAVGSATDWDENAVMEPNMVWPQRGMRPLSPADPSALQREYSTCEMGCQAKSSTPKLHPVMS